ncbi:site-specific integrase [Methylobacterium sp. NEAU 140]|uniref:tyrosine-type recombinase/integrase n=1 Tax=Methylobacterium sp. NEAU 140 TaxID=3064945 RepID=UPI0027324A59|nr:site-specific integrase [Methylobacterium sp. NEAU 140]MDP4024035.1 site-specific integrase [Methylobacterium sp. NEAU 140]
MARTLREATLDTRAARLRLAPSRKPYWRSVEGGLQLGYRRGDRGGVWRARRYVDGRYLETTLGVADDETDADGVKVLTFRHALAAARSWWQAEERRELGAPEQRAGPYTVGAALDDYLSHYVAKGGKSENATRTAAEVHVRPALGAIVLDRLTTRKVRDWHHALANAPRRLRTRLGEAQQLAELDDDPEAVRARRATANRVLTILKAALNHAFAERHASTDAAWRAVKPFREVDAPLVRFFTEDECRRLVNAAEPEFRRLVQGALLTGMRFGELGRLKVSEVNLDAGTATVRRGKGGKGRHVVLTDEARDLFRSLIAGRPGSTLVFAHDDGRPWGMSHQIRPMTEACRRAGIVPAAGFHILRHTHGSALAMRGVPMQVIAQQLGHANTRMTERHYAHLAPNYVANTIRANFPILNLGGGSNIADLGRPAGARTA